MNSLMLALFALNQTRSRNSIFVPSFSAAMANV